MGVKKFPARLSDLPTFTYTKAISNAVDRHKHHGKPKSTRHKATSVYKGKKILPRHITQTLVDLARWKANGSIRRPRNYPAHLRHPWDILQAVLYSKESPQKGKAVSKNPTSTPPVTFRVAASLKRCAACHVRADTAEEMCNCVTAPWENKNTLDWQAKNVDLRWVDDHLGIATYALNPLKRDTVLGEYIGELVPASFLPEMGSGEDRYLFDIVDEKDTIVAFVDGLRVGNWTRFINHSCEPNAVYDSKRVGRELRHVIVAMKDIKKGEEVTVDYGQTYWEVMNDRHVWCGCRASTCKYKEAVSALDGPLKKGRKAKKKV
ncbi:hypothetical protein EKO04_004823 [Ascochyta lentis]|uniref:SET domain-containing protein n=1 Tax=Ascochyta lentis TaxID=205686 RepID=A0A8H7MJD3_9PLEO|nr:hypothetical protein EKO04_004823 [Ascochyta lentis]